MATPKKPRGGGLTIFDGIDDDKELDDYYSNGHFVTEILEEHMPEVQLPEPTFGDV